MNYASSPDKFLQSLRKEKQKEKAMLDFGMRFLRNRCYINKPLNLRFFLSFSINPLSFTKQV